MWPSFNQLLCAALPNEVPYETRMGQSLLLHQYFRTANQGSIQGEMKKFCLTFLRERSHMVCNAFWIAMTWLWALYLGLFMCSPSKQDSSHTANEPVAPCHPHCSLFPTNLPTRSLSILHNADQRHLSTREDVLCLEDSPCSTFSHFLLPYMVWWDWVLWGLHLHISQ